MSERVLAHEPYLHLDPKTRDNAESASRQQATFELGNHAGALKAMVNRSVIRASTK